MSTEDNLIKVGNYFVIQRQSFMKLHKLKINGTVSLGKCVVELDNIIGKPYYSTFRMSLKPRNNRVYTLEQAEHTDSIQSFTVDKSGTDNRDIVDDGQSQQLSTEDILKLREEAVSSSDIVEKLISNSKTFNNKTGYSQEKYMKKKERKYFEYVHIRKPSVRLLAEIYYRQDPGKILGIRIDDLSQILSYANVQDNSKVLLYDSGSCGLLMAAVMHRIGKDTSGVLIHMCPGNICQNEAYNALQFSQEQNERCINVCLYSVLRCFYQNTSHEQTSSSVTEEGNGKSLVEEENDVVEREEMEVDSLNVSVEDSGHLTQIKAGCKRKTSGADNEQPAKKTCWQIDNERACKVLQNKMDSLVIVAKEHPSTIVHELLSFLNGGGIVVIFSLVRESLESLYFEMKNRADIICLKLCSTMLRNYQVLPNRTHPDVNMTCGGYILTGFKIDTRPQ